MMVLRSKYRLVKRESSMGEKKADIDRYRQLDWQIAFPCSSEDKFLEKFRNCMRNRLKFFERPKSYWWN